MIIPKRKTNLTEQDYQMLAASFISREIALAAVLFRVGDIEGAELIGRKPKADLDFSGVVFSYCQPPDYSKIVEYDLRLDTPHTDGIGEQKKERKYLKSYGSRSAIYFVPGITSEMLQDISIPIYFCEGAKKALSLLRVATQGLAEGEKWRFIPIALSGVWNFSGVIGKASKPNGGTAAVKGLITDFQLLDLTHRQVVIVFDNDTHTNYLVKLARMTLGNVLQREKQAVVYFVDLPKYDEKRGIDDLLGEWDRKDGERFAVKECLELFEKKYLFNNTIQTVLSDGKSLNIFADERNKFKVVYKDERGETLAVDTFKPAENEKRNKFIKQINDAVENLSDASKLEIQRELIKLAGVSELLTDSAKDSATATGETIETSFQVLKDGRIIEQIKNNSFAVYNPGTKEYSVMETVTDSDGLTYLPIDDELLQNSSGIQLADELTEYGTEKELIADIQKYLSTYLDLKPLFLKLTALYILFTYLFDTVLELSYLQATGDAGSGKSRFGMAVNIASHRGLALITPSAASLFRIVDKFKPTLFLDEFNSDANSDDGAAIIQILNAGFQKTAQIPRMLPAADGTYKTELFDGYCPKIIGSLKKSQSGAFNSRCIEIQMERTHRNDIPLRLTHKLLDDAQELRNKLTLYRLRNYQNDIETRLDRAEAELKAANIQPRLVQVNIPLFALIDDEGLKKEFIDLLTGRNEDLHADKLQTPDGELVRAIHVCLFDVEEDDGGKEAATWKEGVTIPDEDKPCEYLRLAKIALILNAKKKDRDHVDNSQLGKKIHGLGALKTKQIKVRSSSHYNETAVVFNSHYLNSIFGNYGLPVPDDFCLDHLDHSNNLIVNNDLNGLSRVSENGNKDTCLDQAKPNDFNNNIEWSKWSKQNSADMPLQNVDEVF